MSDTLDPSAQAVLDAVAEAGLPSFETLSPAEARAAYIQRRGAAQPPMPALDRIEDMEIRTAEAQIPLRIYRPTPATGPAPALMFFHGGGWVIGNLESHNPVCRILAESSGMTVISVDYRLAPENRFPAGITDCIDATLWAHENAGTLGIDPDRMAVAGDSAGGGFAAAVALYMRDLGPMALKAQALIYPVTDLGMTHPSHSDPKTDMMLTHALMRWFRDNYIRSDADIDDWRASPLRAPSLEGLPPAHVLTAGFDPLCDEGRAYADRLRAAGVTVEEDRYPGLFHGFVTMGGAIPQAATAARTVGRWLAETV